MSDDYLDDLSSSTERPPQFYSSLNEDKLKDEAEEDHIKQLIEKGEPIPPTTLWAAVYWCKPESVDLLLSAGVDPNRRHAKAEEIMLHAEHDWLDRDPDRLDEGNDGNCSPIHLAGGYSYNEEERKKTYRIVESLLRHGADIYAVYATQLEEMDGIFNNYARPLFPGEEIGHPPKPDDYMSSWISQKIINGLPDGHVGPMPPALAYDFGLCSGIHTVLEGNRSFKTFLDSPEFMRDLKLEHRSPQGRTLFLSACCNNVGADALLGKVLRTDYDLKPTLDKYTSDPRAAFPPGIYSAPCIPGAQPRTAIQALLNLGADPLATDNQGKNALHLLLDTHSGNVSEPPVMRQSLRYLIAQFPSLVNQPDRNGMTPIHAAIRRLWKYTNAHLRWLYIDLYPPEDCVRDLIEAGADVHARDAQNNTVLHYLADSHLDTPDHGQGRRDIFYMLLDKYNCITDINTRNNLGQTPIQILLGHTYHKDEWNGSAEPNCLSSWYPSPTTRAVDTELFTKLDEAGVDWMVRDRLGRTLLHGVAQTRDWEGRAERRCRYLIQKGVDPLARDSEGKTARDLAPPRRGIGVMNLLRDVENAAVRDQPHDALDNAVEK